MANVQIIGAAQSPFVWATRIVAEEKGVPYDLVAARPHTPDVLAINPFGKIPVMRHGDLELSESRSIMGYFDAAFDGPPLMPRDVKANARAEQWVQRQLQETHPVLMWRYLAHYLFPANGTPDRAAIDQAVPAVEKCIALLDARLASSPYLGGETFTLADVYLLPVATYLHRAPESAALLAKADGVKAWLARCTPRRAYQATQPAQMSAQQRANGASMMAERG